MAKVVNHLEGDLARYEGGRGPQPYIFGRDEQGANQDDRHEAPADGSSDSTAKPVSQKRRGHGAAVRDEDRQEEPTHLLHRSRSRTIETSSLAIVVTDLGPDNNRSPLHHRQA